MIALIIMTTIAPIKTNALTLDKATLIDSILKETREVLLTVSRQEGRKMTGMNYYGAVYTDYPLITKEMMEPLIEAKIPVIEEMLNLYPVEDLVLGYDDYFNAIKGSSYEWRPAYETPQYVELVVNSMFLEHAFKFAQSNHTNVVKAEKEEKEQVEYEDGWTPGMITPSKRVIVENIIEKDFVPSLIQSNYQKGITVGEFTELFVQALFTYQNDRNENAMSIFKSYWDFETLNIDNFLSKVTTEIDFDNNIPDHIKVAYCLGLFDDSDIENLNINDELSREDAAVMLLRYIQSNSGGSSDDATLMYSDFYNAAEEKQDAVGRMVSNRIMAAVVEPIYSEGMYSVDTKGEFQPQSSLTREDAIVTIHELGGNSRSKYFRNMVLRGFVDVTMNDLMSGFHVSEQTVAMKKSGYDSVELTGRISNDYMYFRENGLALEYPAERLNSIWLFPYIDDTAKINNSLIEDIVEGQNVLIDYDLFTCEYNTDNYLVEITKVKDYGYLYGIPDLRYMDEGAIIPLEAISEESLVLNEVTSVTIPAKSEFDKSIYMGHHNIYPMQWLYVVEGQSESRYSDVKPLGTEIGYATRSDEKVSVNGHLVNAYNIAGLLAIELDVLKDFGYNYEFINNDYTYNEHLVERGEIKMIQPNVILNPENLSSPYENLSSEKEENKAIRLIGDKYDVIIYQEGDEKTHGALRTYTTESGYRLILVDELARARYFQPEILSTFDKDFKEGVSYIVEGSPYAPSNLYQNHLAIIDRTASKLTQITLLSLEELERIDSRYMIAYEYPQLANTVLSDEEIEAWYVAQLIVKNAVKSNMTDTEKVIAIGESLKSHGYYLDNALRTNFQGYSNYDGAYEALVEKYANYSGWYKAYEMCYTIAGFTEKPEPDSDAKEIDYGNNGRLTSKIAVFTDGVWHYVNFMPQRP